MAQPIQSYPNMYPPQPTGTEGMIKGGGFIPNGQPTQFGRPPVYPEKAARPMIGHQAPVAHPMPTNGNQQYSHPSSLSSHSSRDPSPVPYQRSPAASDNLSTSSPVLSSSNRPPSSSSQLHHSSVQSTPSATPPPAPSPQNNHQPHQVAAHPAASQPRPPQVDPDPAGPPPVGPQAGGSYRPQGPPGPPPPATESGPTSRQFSPQQPPYVAPQTAPINPQLTHPRQQMTPTSPISVNTSSAATQNAQSEQNRQQYNPQSQSELNRPRQQNVTQSQSELNRQQYLPQSQSELNRQPNIPQSQLSGLQQAPSLSQPGQYGHSVPPSAARTAFNPPQAGLPRFAAPFQGQTYPTPNIPASDQSARSNQQNSSAGQANQTVPPPSSGPASSGSSGAGVAFGSDRYPALPTGQPTGQQGAPAQGQVPGGAPVRTNALGTLPRPEPAQLAYPETTAAGFTSQLSPAQPSVLSQLQLIGTQTQSRMSPYAQPPHAQPPHGMQNGPTSGPPPSSQAVSFPPQSRVGPAPGIRPPPSGMGSATGMRPLPPGMGPPMGMRPMGTGPPSGMGPPTGMGPSPGMGPHPSGMGPPSGGTGYPPTGMGTPPTGMVAPPTRMEPPHRMGAPPSGMGPPPPMGMGPPPSGMGPLPMGMGPPPMGMGPPPTGMGPPPTGPHPPSGPPTMPPGSYPQPGAVLHPYGQPQASQPDASHLPKRYPQQTSYNSSSMRPNPAVDANFNQQLAGLSVAQTGFSKLWGADSYDLLQTRNILPAEKVEMPKVKLQQEFLDAVNCSPEIFRCTMTKIPETNSLLQKSRLPLGILIHPFKDLNHLAVIQCQSIVRCRACRTYINPFVYFVDHKRWKCNLCFRVNELPEEFQFDPVSKTYGDPSRRPEIRSATIEFIAPSEYMLRPPQPAVYLFLLDVSCLAAECGYLRSVCDVLLDELDRLPGDGRTQCGFVTYDSAVHFYNLTEGLNQPQQMVVVDVNDIFLPCPFSLVVNLNESKELIRDLLKDLPKRFAESHDTHSALGAALQAAYKLMAPTGGRITVFQACLPNLGPGALASREDPSARANKEVPHLNPATDFYKRLALDCSGQQVAVDLFVVNQQYCDLATLSGISRFSGGSIHHFPLFKTNDPLKADAFEQAFRRYLTRKLGLEAVMRIRCSRGLAIHTFHGNFFVRSTDLLSLPNVNPDAGFGMQVSVEESLSDLQNVCFQAALLYTSSKGERRIRVHTLCLPVAANLSDILQSADQQCIVGLLAKMAVDRSLQSSLSDAREAFVNVAVDILAAYKVAQSGGGSTALLAPFNLRLLPVYILALLKYVAFRTGQSTRLDDRVFAMCQMKTLPLATLIQEIYPDLYPVHTLSAQPTIDVEGTVVPQPPRLQLTAEKLEAGGAFLLDGGDHMILFIGRSVNTTFCQAIFGVHTFQEISERLHDLPEIDTPESESLRNFVNYLQMEKACPATLQIIRDDSQHRQKFYDRLLEDRTESSLSYYEFLQHLKTNVK